MTAHLSPAPALTAEEAARVAVFDAAEEPEEVTVEKVARALCDGDAEDHGTYTWAEAGEHSEELCDDYRRAARHAIAALAALRGDRAPLAGQHTTDEEGR